MSPSSAVQIFPKSDLPRPIGPIRLCSGQDFRSCDGGPARARLLLGAAMLDAELRERKFSRRYTNRTFTFIGGQRDDHWRCFKRRAHFAGASLSASAQAGWAMHGLPAA